MEERLRCTMDGYGDDRCFCPEDTWNRRWEMLTPFPRMNATSSKTDERIDKLADQLSTLVEIVSKKVVTPTPVKAVEESYVTCASTVGYSSEWNGNQEDTDIKRQTNFQGSTAQIPPPVIPISIPEPDVLKTLPKTTPVLESDIPKSLPKPTIPFSFTTCVGDVKKSRICPVIKELLMNRKSCFEDMECMPRLEILVLGASINLMPLSIWKKLSLPENFTNSCHFMCKEGIVLGHKISNAGIEVDHAKVDGIAKLPHPTTVKGVRSFLEAYEVSIFVVPDLKPYHRTHVDASDLRMTVGENRASWSDKLDEALWAFRTAFKTPIGCTPYKLVYGKSCHLPIELEHKAYWALKHANFDLKTAGDHRKLQLNELNELRYQAYENSLIYKERTKKLHDSKIKNRIFNVGDRVLLFYSLLKIFSGKLKTRWSGPFTITKVFPYGTIELSQPDGPNFKVNGHRVKHYFGGDLPPKEVQDLPLS
ncbi:reverse transcriptase domain-containing protein [Tanacetum coccineum]